MSNSDNAYALREITDGRGGYFSKGSSVFPGIEFLYDNAHVKETVLKSESPKNSHRTLEIIYCREGRMECELGGEFLFLSKGDLMLVTADKLSQRRSFPLNHYHGLTVKINLDKTPRCLSCILEGVTVSPEAIAEKFCKTGGYVARANPSFEHIFSELYSIPENIREGYQKIKVLELLLFLSSLDIENDELSKRLCSVGQVTLAKSIARILTEHINDRITVESIACELHVSPAHIKNTFKSVYGVPIGSYIRRIKMESAAYMLEFGDKSILEIAGLHGYDNPSKFASAFRAIKGLTPTEYRSTVKPKKL